MLLKTVAASLLLATTAAAFAATATNVESRPGAVAIQQTAQMLGTIAAIQADTREVTLSMSDGEEAVVVCGPEVKNFDQLGVGDAVEMEFVQALALELRKGSTAPISRTVEAAAAGAEPGASPAGAGGVRVRVVAEVVGLDPETRIVSLRGPQRTIDLKVNDPEQFAGIAIGDRVEGTYVEALAVQVTPLEAAD
jgi:Cu/Ag efflux protein CusF